MIPIDIHIPGNDIFCMDQEDLVVAKYDLEGNVITQFVGQGQGASYAFIGCLV